MENKKINLESIILEAYGCKDAHDFQKSYDVSMQMIKEICIETCRQTLELAAENAKMKCTNYKGEWTVEKEYLDGYTDIIIDKQSILDVIKLVE